MGVLYIDCNMGLSSNKLFGALLGLLENPDNFLGKFNEIGLGNIHAFRRTEASNGILGNVIDYKRTDVDEVGDDEDEEFYLKNSVFGKHSREQALTEKYKSRTFGEVKELIDDLSVKGKVRKKAISIYESIARASAKVKGIDEEELESVKLHRTGSRDIIAGVVGSCMILNEISFSEIIVSGIAVGYGETRTSAGKTEIPIPVLKLILDDAPYFAGNEEGEVCTLDGAATVMAFADRFEKDLEISPLRKGVGLGNREYKTGTNCVKVIIGNITNEKSHGFDAVYEAILLHDNEDTLVKLAQKLKDAGVDEAYTIPIHSLFGESGVIFRCSVTDKNAAKVKSIILEYSSAQKVRIL